MESLPFLSSCSQEPSDGLEKQQEEDPTAGVDVTL